MNCYFARKLLLRFPDSGKNFLKSWQPFCSRKNFVKYLNTRCSFIECEPVNENYSKLIGIFNERKHRFGIPLISGYFEILKGTGFPWKGKPWMWLAFCANLEPFVGNLIRNKTDKLFYFEIFNRAYETPFTKL